MVEFDIDEGLSTETDLILEENSYNNIKSIILSKDRFIIEDAEHSKIIVPSENEISGVFFRGIQYYDLINIGFINNSNIAVLIDLLKSLLEKGIEVRFLNVNTTIKSRIQSLGLDHILICG